MPNQQRILVTGGYGCIGAETVKWLLRNTEAVVLIASRSASESRTTQTFAQELAETDSSRLRWSTLDVRHPDQLHSLLADHRISHVAHLAALQTPDCNAHRDDGLQINLAGTQNLIEAMKLHGAVERFVFASSIAVYGPRASYATKQVPMLAQPAPVNVYGTWKLAGEHISRIFHEETGVPTLSLRPGVLFGPGRDLGLTSTPTTAMKHIARNLPFEIPFRTRQDYQYAPDVGAAFAMALLEPFEGYSEFTLPGRTVDTRTLVDIMNTIVDADHPDLQFQITVGQEDVPFVCDLEFQPFLDTFPMTPITPLADAIGQSIAVFRQQFTNADS